jgi:hypothetical protein
MTVGLSLDFSYLGLDDYDRICEALDFPSDWPDGLVAHAAAQVDGNLRVLDAWESREHFDRFVEDRLQEAMREAMGEPVKTPQVTQTELHSFYTR